MPGFSAEDLELLRRALPAGAALKECRPGDPTVTFEVSVDTITLVAREDGVGKRTPFEDYRLTSRGGTGVIAIDLPEDGSVAVAGALSVRDTDEVMLLTAKGQSVRTRVKDGIYKYSVTLDGKVVFDPEVEIMQ